MLSVFLYLLIAIFIFLSETCYYLQKLVSFARCCTYRNFFYPKLFLTNMFQLFFEPKFVGSNFSWLKTFSELNFLATQILLDQYVFHQNFLEQNFFERNFFGIRYFLGQIKFSNKSLISHSSRLTVSAWVSRVYQKFKFFELHLGNFFTAVNKYKELPKKMSAL